MRKTVLFIFSLLIISSLLLAACGPTATEAPPTEAPAAPEEPAEEPPTEEPVEEPAEPEEPMEKTVVTLWSFTNEMETMAVAYECLHPEVDIQFTMIPMTDGEYQTKLLASLGTADAPDVIALEAAFVKEYVESDFLADVGDLMPMAEEAETFPFVIDVGTYDGVTKGYSFQATPGGLFYRRSLAQEYFGTDDPEEMQALLSDLDKFVEILDKTLRRINSDYDAKRFKNIALNKPRVHVVKDGTFYRWMKKRDKLGGQNKVPRLANTREYLDDILSLI